MRIPFHNTTAILVICAKAQIVSGNIPHMMSEKHRHV